MPAELSVKNGQVEAFTGLTPAWWDGKGEYVIDHYPTSEEIFEGEGVLNWKVVTHPLRDGVTGKVIDNYFATVREDTGAHLGVGLTGRYEVVQNREAFDFLDSLHQDGLVRYESGGALKGGRMVWVLARMPSIDTIAEGDCTHRYILWVNHHDGGGSLYAFPTNVRAVCWNTVSVALRNRNASVFAGIRHTGDVKAKLESAREVLLESDRRFTEFAQKAQRLAEVRYSRPDARQYIETLFPTPSNDNRRSKSIRERKVESVRNAMRHDANQLPAIRGTYWQLLNSVTHAVDHDSVIAFRGRGRDRFDNRMISLLTDRGAELKKRAFELAVSMAS